METLKNLVNTEHFLNKLMEKILKILKLIKHVRVLSI